MTSECQRRQVSHCVQVSLSIVLLTNADGAVNAQGITESIARAYWRTSSAER